MSNYLDNLLANPDNRIAIVSGEGEGPGIAELFTGKRSRLAIKRRIIKETCEGDRWAYAVIETHNPRMIDGHAVLWSGHDEYDMQSVDFPEIDD